jgi:4-hydroxyacetophenone monooxygenase
MMQDGAADEIDIDPALLREALGIADVPTLVALLAEFTGDEKWLAEPFRPKRARGMDSGETGGLPPEVQDEIRLAAYDAIMARREGLLSPPPADESDLVRLLSAATGEIVPDEYGPLVASALTTRGEPEVPQALDWSGRTAVIIGAGICGLAAAIHLQQLGLPYVIFERHGELGGSWWESRYPGAGVDTPSQLYEYSFLPYDWHHYFATREEVFAYLHAVADQFDIKPHIRLNTTVEAASWDEAANEWELTVTGEDGGKSRVRAHFVFSAVGVFNKPSVPDVPGLDTFPGPVFHTSDWPDVDLSGKRVAVFGNGASAMQVVPAIAPKVEHLTVVQRSPQWVAPFPKFQQPIPDAIRYLMKAVPDYRAWYRLRLMWNWMDKLHPVLQRDPSWPHQDRSVNSRNEHQRIFFAKYLKSQLKGRPDLIEQCLPAYPPFGKRMLNDNGWFAALRRDNVSLETSPHSELVGRTLKVNGHEHPVDVIVLATGYSVVRFLATLRVTGRDGTTLDDVWGDDDARAFLGLAVPKFPNFFICVGPNIAPGHGGSLMMSAEAQLDYTALLLREFHARGGTRLEVAADSYDSYNEAVDAAHANMVWTHPGMSNYTRNKAGRVVMSSPFKIIDFWTRTRTIDWRDWQVDS